MKDYSIMMLLIIGLEMRLGLAVDWCGFECGPEHTMCRFPKEGGGPNCQGHKAQDLTLAQRQFVLHLHNKKRNEVANGEHDPQPPASNMMELVWDEELATVAKRWGDQCEFEHDKCRATSKFKVAGQNLAIRALSKAQIDFPVVENLLDLWFREIKDCPVEEVDQFADNGSGNMIGHYTQMMWGETRAVGCALTLTEMPSNYSYYLVCNYGPTGNWLNRPMYLKGEACTRCPSDTVCGSNYRHLCSTGEMNDFSLGLGAALWATPVLLAISLISIFLLV